jgi:hypothetical protein
MYELVCGRKSQWQFVFVKQLQDPQRVSKNRPRREARRLWIREESEFLALQVMLTSTNCSMLDLIAVEKSGSQACQEEHTDIEG